MLKYFFKRMLWLIPILICATVVVYTLMYFCPGDPVELILGATATQREKDILRASMGLDEPYIVQLAAYMKKTFIDFDLGTSWATDADIAASLKERLPRTLILALITMAISAVVGIPLGIYAAVKQGRLGDSICMLIALAGISIPGFWLALLLIILFAVKLAWLPAMGIGGPKYYILPALSGCFGGIAYQARQTRSSMLEVIRSDYITTARAKGVKEYDVIMKHCLKNAMIPIVTIFGHAFGNIVGGSMIIETIFTIPGMGSFIIQGVNNRDYPVVEAGTMLIAIFFAFSMVMVDIVYAFVDPRIKAQYVKKKKVSK